MHLTYLSSPNLRIFLSFSQEILVYIRQRMHQLGGALLCCASALSLPAHSADDTMTDLLKVLRDKGTISEKDYQALESAAKQEKVEESANTSPGLVLDTGSSALKLHTEDGAFKFQFGGRLMLDAAYYDEDVTPLGSGAEIRRARLYAKGTVYNDWFYKAQVDFAGNEVTIKDFYMGYSGYDSLKITLGNLKEPFSLNELTSSKYTTFMERALPNAFAPSRNIGVALSSHGEKWGAAAGYFFDGVENENSPDNQGWGLTGRAYFAPINGDGSLMHLGASASYRGDDAGEIRYRQRPESHVTSTRLVDTGTIAEYDNQTLLGAEAAAVFGPFSAQGEYIQTNLDLSGPGSDPTFNGWYILGSFFLTGEHRPYKVSSGTFQRVKPRSVVGKGGHGAWELAARYSSIDLQDSGIDGGKENDITVGLNWYATPNIRFMANYIFASTDPTSVVEYPESGDEDVNIFQVRGQIDF
jgi:phosphate-selective porin OprO/OprP